MHWEATIFHENEDGDGTKMTILLNLLSKYNLIWIRIIIMLEGIILYHFAKTIVHVVLLKYPFSFHESWTVSELCGKCAHECCVLCSSSVS